MAVFKCKMCGGSLEVQEGQNTCTCEYCGTEQTLPKLDSDKKANLYDRANHFRRNNDYDKAAGIYEQILNEDSTDAEAYWSLVLCRYGIEYVEDPGTHRRIPTVNRAQYTSIYADEDYKAAIEHADMTQKSVYEREAAAIDEIQRGILTISEKESPYDVFICYKETDEAGRRTQDSVLANDLYHQLVQEGFRVFYAKITLEDKLGQEYEPYIFAALNSAKVMVVLGTKPEYFKAVWVKNEWSRFLALVKNSNGKKILIPAYKNMDPYDLPDEFSHLQAQDMSKLGFMQDLIRGIKKITKADEPEVKVKESVTVSESVNVEPLLKRAFMFLEDGDWEQADAYCEKVLDQDPENAKAYLGKLMAEIQVRKTFDLGTCGRNYTKNKNYIKALRFGDEKLRTELKGYADHFCSTPVNVFEFSKMDDGYAIVGVNSQELDTIVIPKQYKGEPVTEIGNCAFEYYETLTSITIPDSVKRIGDGAFIFCPGLADENGFVIIRGVLHCYSGEDEYVAIPDGVASIGFGAFMECKTLTSIIIPDSVTSIGDCAFQYCESLTSVTIPDSVTSIGDSAFSHCKNLRSLTIPNSVTSIGEEAFAFCPGLADEKGFVIIRGVLNCYSGEHKNVTIPDGVMSIGARAFEDCKTLTSVTIPDSVMSIGHFAFAGCKTLTSVTIPGGVTSIAVGVFNGCKTLTSVTIPDSVMSIGDRAFEWCKNLTSIKLPDSVVHIGEEAFKGCTNLTSITMPDSVGNITSDTFDEHLKEILCFGDYSKLESVFREDQFMMKRLEQGKEVILRLKEEQEQFKKEQERFKRERENLQSELANLKGLFTGKRRREIEARLAELENLLKQ